MQIEALTRIHKLSLQLAALPSTADLCRFLASRLHDLTGASVVAVGEFRPADRTIVLRCLESDSELPVATRSIPDGATREMVWKIDNETCQRIVSSRIEFGSSIEGISFGTTPPCFSSFLKEDSQLREFVGIGFVFEGDLYGISALAFQEGVELPSRDLLEAVASVAAVSLRRRKLEEELRISDARYRSLFDRSQFAVYVTDLAGNLIDASASFLAMTGILPDELGRFNLNSLLSEEQQVQAGEDGGNVLQNGSSTRPSVFNVRRKDGRAVWIETEGTMLLQDGQPYAIHGVARDITKHKDMERALRESEKRFRELFENAALGMYRTSPNGEILAVNRAMLDLLGFDRIEDLLARNLDSEGFEPGYSREEFKRRIESEGIIRGLESAWSRRDGTAVFVRENARLQRDESGEPLYYEGTVEDISDRKRAEQEIVEWKRRYDTLAQSAGNIVYDYVAADGSIIWGGSVEKVLGYSIEELQGGAKQWEELIHPDDRGTVVAGFADATSKAIVFQAEYRFQRKDGSYLLILDTGYPLLTPQGQVARYVGILTDITEQRRAEGERVRLEEQLRQSQKMESIGRLAGGIAHDFNNLLTVINGYSDLILTQLTADNPLRDAVEEIHKAGNRAAALTGQLLAFSRKQVMQMKPMSLDRAVSDLQPMLTRLVGEDVEVSLLLNSAPELVLADPHQIEQVLLNLVVNARDAMPAGGKLTLETALDDSSPADSASAGHVILAVADNGVGMDEETLQRIFEPFFTTKPTGKGTGLGLSMVQGIVAQSGGAIEVSSRPGMGTTFRIRLPRYSALYCPRDQETPGTKDQVGRETVLVVEDQPDVRAYAANALRSFGYNVICADGPQEALTRFDTHSTRVDLVLTDVVMPNMNGRELAEELTRRIPGVKILYMSGYTNDVIFHHGLDEGAGFIQKPFSPQQLAIKVRQALAR